MIVAAAVGVSACFLVGNVAVLAEQAPSYEYRVLATNKTSTMQRDIQEAGDAGFEYKGQTAFTTTFGQGGRYHPRAKRGRPGHGKA